MAKNSGITKGKSHKEGGIPMTVKSTGQKIEVEGGEGIVNKYAMSNTDKFEFEGKQKTSCEIISDLNQKKGDGVAFECDTVENKKYKFKKGGKLSFTDASDFYNKMELTIKEANDFLDKYEYTRSRNDSPKLAVNVKIYDVNYGIEEALDTYQNRKGNFDMEKMRYVKKDLYLDEQWVYEQYNTFLDDTLYFFKEDLLADFGDVLKDKQIYQEGRMGGWLVFNDDGELATMVDELESILNNNFSEDGELVGYDRWGYDMEPVTFKEFKEEGDYDDAIYYAERIKYLLTDYENVVDAIKTAHKNIPSNWKAFLDDRVDEHISENKKRYKIFTEDDPDFAKGGMVYDLRDMLINRGDDEFVEFQERQSGNTYDRVKEEYINETKAFTELYHTFKDRLEDYHGEEVYAKGGKVLEILKDKSFSKYTPKESGWYIEYFPTKERMEERRGTGIGYDADEDTYYHNSVSGYRNNSVWNHKRKNNDKGLGWYSFEEDEILEIIDNTGTFVGEDDERKFTKYAKGGKIYQVKDMDKFDKWFDETESLYGGFKKDEVRYEKDGVYISDDIYKESDSLNRDNLYAKGGKTKLEMDVFVQLQEENKKEIRYLMIGKQGKKGFSGLIMDYVGGGQFQEFYFADGIDIESELYDQTDGDYDNEEVEDVFIDKKGKDFYNLIHETMDDLVDFGDDYQPILQKNPPKNKLAYNTGDITPITVGMTIFEDESKGKYAKGGMNKNDNIPKDFDLENAEEIRGDERLDSYVKEYYGEDADWTLYESEGDELERDAVAVDDFGNKSVFYIKFKKGGMTKNERVEKGFPKNPENITKDELHEHFDLNNDGKVTLEEYAEHIDYHCENPEVLDDELEEASYQRMFMYAKGGITEKRVFAIDPRDERVKDIAVNELTDIEFMYEASDQGLVFSSWDSFMDSNERRLKGLKNLIIRTIDVGEPYAKGGKVSRLEALNKWKKMTDQERSNKISRLYPKLSRVEALNKFQKLTDKERSDKVASLYAKGGRVKYLSDYINDKNSKLFEETGTFFAFSNEQFKEQMKKGKKYVNMGGGMITEKGNEEKLVKGLNKNYKEGIKQDLKENGKEKIILRELQNYEAFYTGDITDTVENLKDYPGITKEDIMKSYRKNYSKYSDFAKGGRIEITDKDIVDVLFNEYPGIHNQIVDYIIEEMDIIEKEIKDEDKVYVLYHNFNRVYNDIMDSLEGDDYYKKGGAIYEGDRVKIKDSGKKMKVTDISKNKKDQVEFKGKEGTFLIGDLEKMAKGGKLSSDDKKSIDEFIEEDISMSDKYDDMGLETPDYEEYAYEITEQGVVDKSKKKDVLKYIKSTLGKRDEYIKYGQEEDYAKGGKIEKYDLLTIEPIGWKSKAEDYGSIRVKLTEKGKKELKQIEESHHGGKGGMSSFWSLTNHGKEEIQEGNSKIKPYHFTMEGMDDFPLRERTEEQFEVEGTVYDAPFILLDLCDEGDCFPYYYILKDFNNRITISKRNFVDDLLEGKSVEFVSYWDRDESDEIKGDWEYAKGGYTANVEEASFQIDKWLMIDEEDNETMNLWFEAIDEGDHEQIKIMIEDFGDDDKLEFYGIKSSKDVEELSKYLVDSSYAKGGKITTAQEYHEARDKEYGKRIDMGIIKKDTDENFMNFDDEYFNELVNKGIIDPDNYYAKGGMTEKDKLDEAIRHFEDKIKKQGRITNARDEEQLSKLKELRKSFAKGGKIDTIEKVDDLTNDIMDDIRATLDVDPDSDLDDELYSDVHNNIKKIYAKGGVIYAVDIDTVSGDQIRGGEFEHKSYEKAKKQYDEIIKKDENKNDIDNIQLLKIQGNDYEVLESMFGYAKGGKIKNKGYFVAVGKDESANTLFQVDSGKWDEVTRSKEEAEKLDLNEIADESQTVEAISVKKITEVDPSSVAKGFKDIPKEPFVVLFVAKPSKINPIGIQYWVTMDMDGDTEWGQDSTEEMLEEFSDDGVTPDIYVLTLDGTDTITLQEGEEDDDDYYEDYAKGGVISEVNLSKITEMVKGICSDLKI